MEKQTGKFRLVVASLVMVFCLFLAGLASATSENGKITLTKIKMKVKNLSSKMIFTNILTQNSK